MRFKSFCLYVCLFTFFAFSFNLGAGAAAPELIFTSWQAGRGVKAGPSDTPSPPATWDTFATNSETQCQLDVTVGYAKNQPANAYQLNSYQFKVTGAISLPGLSETELQKHTFTFPQQQKQQVATGATSFSYSGTGTLSAHWGPTGGREKQRQYCSNYGGTKTPEQGRSLSISVTFIGYYGSDPNNQQKIEMPLSLAQDTPDQMRQEYIDQGVYVPGYAEFVDPTAGYNHSHYGKMMDGGLATYRKSWLDKVNELWRQCSESHNCTHNSVENEIPTVVCEPPNCPVDGCTHETIAPLELADFSVESGYRNPHHNRYHVKISSEHPHGLHQYGYALDITTPDIDNDGPAEQTYNNRAESADGVAMSVAAWQAGAEYRPSYESYGNITHADWREDYNDPWPPKNNSSLEITSTQTTTPESPTPPTTETTITYACQVHSGDPSLASSHQWSNAPCTITSHANYLCLIDQNHSRMVTGYSGSFYECQPHTTGACEHTYLLSESSSHTTRASCAATNVYGDTCRAGAGYACQYHWHDFPTPITGPCGHIYGIHVKSSHARQASCPETNSNGDSCTVTDFYACQTHTHQYPAPTTVACGGNAWTGCTEQVSSESEHYVSSCSNCSNSYWSCRPVHGAVKHETPRSCTRNGCDNTSFTLCSKPQCDVNSDWKCRAE